MQCALQTQLPATGWAAAVELQSPSFHVSLLSDYAILAVLLPVWAGPTATYYHHGTYGQLAVVSNASDCMQFQLQCCWLHLLVYAFSV